MAYKNIEDKREYYRKWRIINREKCRADNRRLYRKNLEKRKESNRKYRTSNIEACKKRQLNWKMRNPDYHKKWYEKNKFSVLQRKNNWPIYRSKLARSIRTTCAICETHFVKPCSDHNHSTGQPRDLLCNKCNSGLAYVENVVWKGKAEAYLSKWNEISKDLSLDPYREIQ